MFYWNEEMDRYQDVIGRVSPLGRLKLGLESVSWTMETMAPPIADPEARSFIQSGIDQVRRAVGQGVVFPDMPAEYEAEFDRLLEDVAEDGAGSLVMAVGTLFSAGDEVMEPEVAFNILWSCYEAVLLREFDEPTRELEFASGRCLAVIDRQKELIDQAV